MTIEASIVEQLQELRRWQMQQQEKLMQQQQEQREILSNEQNRMYHALSLSVEEMNLDEHSLKDFIEGPENDDNLIDLNTPDEDCLSPVAQEKDIFPNYPVLNNENNTKKLNLKVQKMPLTLKNSKNAVKSTKNYNNLYDQINYNSDESSDKVQLLLEDNKKHKFLIDEIPVPSPKKDFNTLLEERLKDSEAVNTVNEKKPVVKKPFLRKGQGLARFMPNTNTNKTQKNPVRPRSGSFTSNTQSSNAKSKFNLERCNSMPKSRTNDNLKKSTVKPAPIGQSKLALKNFPPPRKKSQNKLIDSSSNPLLSEKKKYTETSDSNTSDIEVKNRKEQEEVRIFELLEDKAENSSFCSTSSTVIAFLQQSTPLKQKALLHSASKHKNSAFNAEDQLLEEIVSTKSNNPKFSELQRNMTDAISKWNTIPTTKLKNDKTIIGTVLPYGTDIDQSYADCTSNQGNTQDDTNMSFHVRFSEFNEYKTMTDTSSISSDSQTINYINDKENWTDTSVTSDSSDNESIISQTKSADNRRDETVTSFNCLNKDQDDSDVDEIENYENESERENGNELETKNVILHKDETLTEEKNDNNSLFKSELLKTRLLELEQEIEIFRKESAAIIIKRQRLQEERRQLQEERVSMQRILKEKEELLENEKRKSENILQEEKKRLAREKSALENRMKDAWDKAQKSKQDRQEIQALRDELEELKEEFGQKESKWSANSARQRSQIRVLQTENSKLKQELEKLKQKNAAKLKKSVSSSNTRAIHQINKFLADRKKNLPCKSDIIFDEEVTKAHDNIDIHNEIVLESVEEKVPEKENVKVLKSAESIARTRNLYERLLRDATEGFGEIPIVKKNLINQSDVILNRAAEYNSNSEENICHENSDTDNKNAYNLESPKSSKIIEESENGDDNKCINDEHQKLNINKQGIREVHHNDGRIEYWYPNGNVKKTFPDKCLTKMIYYNGDVQETDKNGTVKYFYAATRTWHTTMPDGLEILEFPDGQVERRAKDGTIEVSFPDGSVRVVQMDGSEKWALKDGTIAETSSDGEKILTLPNGQKEIHTKDHKRREYPDGTVKLVYPDGIQETRYANGRIRLKDKDGNLVLDTHQCN